MLEIDLLGVRAIDNVEDFCLAEDGGNGCGMGLICAGFVLDFVEFAGHFFRCFGSITSGDVLKFSPSGMLLTTFHVAAENHGAEWIDLGPDNCTLYYGSVGNAIKAFPIVSARVASTPSSQSARSFAYPGATPAISAAGTTNAILWAVENSNPAVLHAYDARNLAVELYNSSQATGGRDTFGAGNKFITPTIANGRVFVGTQTGVAIFARFGPGAPTNLRIFPSTP